MHTLTTSNRLVRTVLVLLALVLGLGTATVAVPSTAARAGGGYFMLCLPVFNSSGQIIGYDCRPFPYPVEIDPCPGCPDWAISLEHLVLPEDPYYVEGLNGGLGLLAEAAIADPREAAALRAAAQEEFLAAAERLGDTRTWLGVVGTVDWEGNRIAVPGGRAPA